MTMIATRLSEQSNSLQTVRRQLLGLLPETDGADLDCRRLLEKITGLQGTQILTKNPELDEAAIASLARLVERRIKGEPLAYILGQAGFMGLDLTVTPAVMVPRPETECLVEQLLELNLPDQTRLLDLGTGSGNIALATGSARPNWQILAADISAKALAVAIRNRNRLGLNAVRFVQSNWLNGMAPDSFDVIVSNPPYIAEGDPHLSRGGLPFEPALALTGGKSGLASISYIIQQAGHCLRRGGWLLLEHGFDQSAAVLALLEQAGFKLTETLNDLSGIARISVGQWQ